MLSLALHLNRCSPLHADMDIVMLPQHSLSVRQIFTTVATLNLQPLQQLARQEVPESSEMLGFWVSCGCKNALFVVGYGFIVFGGTTCVRLLLQAAADCNEVSKGSSVLALAARCPAEPGLAMTRLLLEFRANPNQAGRDPFGQTPLMVAAAARNLRCCEALLEAGACVTDEDNEGKNAAELAKEHGLDGLAAKLCAK
eukprot:symbB.v1.2.026040.t1/scaffold2573.1/size76014/1